MHPVGMWCCPTPFTTAPGVLSANVSLERREEIHKVRMCSKQVSVLAEGLRALSLSACGKLHYRRGSGPSVMCRQGEQSLTPDWSCLS